MRICVIDDEKISLNVIRAVLSRMEGVEIHAFLGADDAIKRCREMTFDMIMVDYQMPNMNGVEFIETVRDFPDYQVIPIVMLTADNERDIRIAAVGAGATDFLNKPFDPDELRLRTTNLLALRKAQVVLQNHAQQLDAEVQHATRKLVAQEEELIWRLSRAIETRDGSTGAHICRVATVSEIIARNMGLSDGFCRTLYLATPLHDTGKIGISDAILNKPARLTPQERKEIQRHTQIGAEILENGDSDLIRMAHEIALYHHEKWDGTGYGAGLAGTDIPLSGRIAAVADVLDALCCERAYKPAWPFEQAYAEILDQSGKHFDPACVDALTAGRAEIEAIYTPSSHETSAA